MSYVKLPPAVPKPCSDCPWRRQAMAGWLGPYDANGWIEEAHGEQPIACHQTIPEGRPSWDDPRVRQCKGAAIFRANVAKSPRNPSDAEHGTDPDEDSVFATDDEFRTYHTTGRIAERFAEIRARR